MQRDLFEWVSVSSNESNVQLYIIARYLYMWIWGTIGFNASIAVITILSAFFLDAITSVMLAFVLVLGIANLVILDRFVNLMFSGKFKTYI